MNLQLYMRRIRRVSQLLARGVAQLVHISFYMRFYQIDHPCSLQNGHD